MADWSRKNIIYIYRNKITSFRYSMLFSILPLWFTSFFAIERKPSGSSAIFYNACLTSRRSFSSVSSNLSSKRYCQIRGFFSFKKKWMFKFYIKLTVIILSSSINTHYFLPWRWMLQFITRTTEYLTSCTTGESRNFAAVSMILTSMPSCLPEWLTLILASASRHLYIFFFWKKL